MDNPLTGVKDASATFGPQKGASPTMVGQLEQALKHYANILLRDFGKQVKH